MIELKTTYASYLIDRRLVVDISNCDYSQSGFFDFLTDLYESGARRFLFPTPISYSDGLLLSSDEAWMNLISSFKDFCKDPIIIGIHLNDAFKYINYASEDGMNDIVDSIIYLSNWGVDAVLLDGTTEPDPYSCSHPILKESMKILSKFYIWKSMQNDPYASISGSCSTPEWYSAPPELLNGTTPYTGWSSANIRKTVEIVVAVEYSNCSENFVQSCSNWGLVPCIKFTAIVDPVSLKAYIHVYNNAESSIRSISSQTKRLVVLPNAARRNSEGIYINKNFYDSKCNSDEKIVCPAVVDCSHTNFVTESNKFTSLSTILNQYYFDDEIWLHDQSNTVSSKLSIPNALGLTGAAKAAYEAVLILAEEYSSHPNVDYLSENTSVLIFRHFGNGGSAYGEDQHYEATRLISHSEDSVDTLSENRCLKNPKATIYNDNGIHACHDWMSEFLEYFDIFRHRMAVYANCSIHAPFMTMLQSNMVHDVSDIVGIPSSSESNVACFGNWAEHVADQRWSLQKICQIDGVQMTAAEFSMLAKSYQVIAKKPDGSVDRVIYADTVLQNSSIIDNINNRAFCKWLKDLCRASSAFALSESLGRLFFNHFPGLKISCPSIVPNTDAILSDGHSPTPVFFQQQHISYDADFVASCPHASMAHVGMLAQGHISLPKLPKGVKAVSKCEPDGSQLSTWYINGPVGDCAWVYGNEREPFNYGEISSSSSYANTSYKIVPVRPIVLPEDSPVNITDIMDTGLPRPSREDSV